MPATDHFSSFSSDLGSPATGAFDVVPDDGADLDVLPRAIMVATAGDLAVIMKDGSTATLPALQPGVPYPVRARRILASGTTATGIVGLY